MVVLSLSGDATARRLAGDAGTHTFVGKADGDAPLLRAVLADPGTKRGRAPPDRRAEPSPTDQAR